MDLPTLPWRGARRGLGLDAVHRFWKVIDQSTSGSECVSPFSRARSKLTRRCTGRFRPSEAFPLCSTLRQLCLCSFRMSLPPPPPPPRACWQPELLAAALSCTPQPPGPGGLRIYRGQRETKLGLPSLFCLSSAPRRSRPSALGAMNSDFRFSGTGYLPEEPISFSPSSSYLTTSISQTHKENSCNLSYSLCITSTMIAIFSS